MKPSRFLQGKLKAHLLQQIWGTNRSDVSTPARSIIPSSFPFHSTKGSRDNRAYPYSALEDIPSYKRETKKKPPQPTKQIPVHARQ